MRLAGKVAVITGAGSGIGRAAALLFAQEGAAVVAGVYEPDDPEPLPEPIAMVPCDVTRDEDAASLIRAAIGRHGRLDILVNNAGIESPGTVTETTDENWQRLIDVNLKGQFLSARHAVPPMLAQGSGSIVNNASINGIRGNHRLVAYSASKGGVVAMTMAMALDYAPLGIRVNCVCPAAIENTRMDAISSARASDPQQRREYLLAKHPIGRLGQPQDVAYAMLFLASDESAFITGVALPVDGGRSIR